MLLAVSEKVGVLPDALKAYMTEDTIGGYYPGDELDVDYEIWPMGSIFAIEGQILYSIVRALRPKQVLALGHYHGCSTMHLFTAIQRNIADGDEGKLIVVDSNLHSTFESELVEWVESFAQDYEMPMRRVGLVFEDLDHQTKTVKAVIKQFKDRAKKNAFLISHDALHRTTGEAVQAAYADCDGLLLDLPPSDCGLALCQKS